MRVQDIEIWAEGESALSGNAVAREGQRLVPFDAANSAVNCVLSQSAGFMRNTVHARREPMLNFAGGHGPVKKVALPVNHAFFA